MKEQPHYRILSLDGGGVWAIIQAKALGRIYGEDTCGWEILEDFELAAANSGGAIVLALLLKGLTPNQIAAAFRDQNCRDSIFDRRKVGGSAIGGIIGIGPRYHAPAKLEGLRKLLAQDEGRLGSAFTGMRLDEIANAINANRLARGRPPFHFVITAFDFDEDRTALFRSNTESPARMFRAAPMPSITCAIHASTNAPVKYFNRPAEIVFADGETRRYWDGAVGGHNNPVLVAVTEAVACAPERRDRMQVLSIGTASCHFPIVPGTAETKPAFVRQRQPIRGPDAFRALSDLKKLTAPLLSDYPEAANYLAHLMLAAGQSEASPARTPIVRLNPVLQPRSGNGAEPDTRIWEPYEWFASPSATAGKTLYERLSTLDMDVTSSADVADIERLAELWMTGDVPNQPVLGDAQLAPMIGVPNFGDALDQWLARDQKPAPAPSLIQRLGARLGHILRGVAASWRNWLRSGQKAIGQSVADRKAVVAKAPPLNADS